MGEVVTLYSEIPSNECRKLVDAASSSHLGQHRLALLDARHVFLERRAPLRRSLVIWTISLERTNVRLADLFSLDRRKFVFLKWTKVRRTNRVVDIGVCCARTLA